MLHLKVREYIIEGVARSWINHLVLPIWAQQQQVAARASGIDCIKAYSMYMSQQGFCITVPSACLSNST